MEVVSPGVVPPAAAARLWLDFDVDEVLLLRSKRRSCCCFANISVRTRTSRRSSTRPYLDRVDDSSPGGGLVRMPQLGPFGNGSELLLRCEGQGLLLLLLWMPDRRRELVDGRPGVHVLPQPDGLPVYHVEQSQEFILRVHCRPWRRGGDVWRGPVPGLELLLLLLHAELRVGRQGVLGAELLLLLLVVVQLRQVHQLLLLAGAEARVPAGSPGAAAPSGPPARRGAARGGGGRPGGPGGLQAAPPAHGSVPRPHHLVRNTVRSLDDPRRRPRGAAVVDLEVLLLLLLLLP